MKSKETLTHLLACLRTLKECYLTAHWTEGGRNFYSDHLLFQRLYEERDSEIDTLAEKMVSTLGASSTDLLDQMKLMVNILNASNIVFNGVHVSAAKRCEHLEKMLLTLIKDSVLDLEKDGNLSLGWEDYLGTLCSAHETNLYLLKMREG